MNIKYMMVVLAVAPLVQGQMQRSIAGEIRNAIEDFRDRMPCGFPEYGLPPLAPYKAEHLDIARDNEVLQAYGAVDDFRLYGLNDFNIVTLRVQALLSRMTFKFNWNNVYLTTNYNISLARDDLGLRKFDSAKLSLKNLTAWGVIKYHLSILSSKIRIKELRVYVSLEEVKSEIEGLSHIRILNKKLNRIVEKWIMLAVNDNTDNVAVLTNSTALPFVNDFLSDKTIGDLVANGGGTEEKEPCIPPEEEE